MGNPIKVDDLGVPPFIETTIWLWVKTLVNGKIAGEWMLIPPKYGIGFDPCSYDLGGVHPTSLPNKSHGYGEPDLPSSFISPCGSPKPPGANQCAGLDRPGGWYFPRYCEIHPVRIKTKHNNGNNSNYTNNKAIKSIINYYCCYY